MRFERDLHLNFTTQKSIHIKDGFLSIPLSEKEMKILSLESMENVEITISNKKISLQAKVEKNDDMPDVYKIVDAYMKELDDQKK